VPEQLTVETFSPAIGDAFEVDAGEAGTLELRLADARAVPTESAPRDPFVLTFTGPADPVLAQRTFPFQHPSIGSLEIFLVPIARDEDGATYEAVFA
jgi:hypothetical protein